MIDKREPLPSIRTQMRKANSTNECAQMMTDALETESNIDEIKAYCQIFPETVLYQPEFTNIE